ncbi:MAG TPA: flagellar motor switch protein FliG [Methylocella sp.]|nr:flagellar motor switch protein FliG [Methylocella sp.]
MATSVASKGGPTVKAMKGPEKAAALLLGMGKLLASRLLVQFDADELKQITRSIAQLGTVPVPTLEALVEEFAGQFTNGVDLLGSPDEVQQMLDGILPPEQLADVMSDVTGNSNHAMWDRLSNVPESVFAGFLVKEHPQTAAFIVSKVSPGYAAKVVGQLPRELRNAIMRRMLSIGPVTESAVRIIQGQLQEDLLSNVSRQVGGDQNARMADIINKMDRDHMEDVMQSLAAARPKAAEVLRKLMFTFDDIIKLQSKARSVLFDKIPTELVVLALKGTDAAFRDAILSSLATRARRIVDSELANGGPALQRDVLRARRTIADTALELASTGEIELNSSEDEDEFFE